VAVCVTHEAQEIIEEATKRLAVIARRITGKMQLREDFLRSLAMRMKFHGGM